MTNINYMEFKKYANHKLNLLKEEKTSTFKAYLKNNFVCLKEEVDTCKFAHIAEHHGFDMSKLSIVKDAIYNDTEFAYFIHDNQQCIGLNEDIKIIYMDFYYPVKLSNGNKIN